MSRFRTLLRVLALTLAVLLAGTGLATTAQAAPTASARLAHLENLLPDDARERVAAVSADLEVIDPSQYQCGVSPLDDWTMDQLLALSDEDLAFLVLTGAMAIPSVDAAMFADPDDPFYALSVDGKRLIKTFDRLLGFWTPTVPGTRMIGVHSEVVTDVDRMVPSIMFMFEVPETEAREIARAIADYAAASPGLQYGAHPLLSFTAFAVADDVYPGRPTMVALGDGMLEAYADLGFADVAGRFILAHEVGHTVQIAAGAYAVLPEMPEETRYLELMADAMAAYFSAHPRGLSLQNKRVAAFAEVAYSVGDCAFDSPGHHGTHDQRARTALWAADLAQSARPKSRILTYAEFAAAFDAAYPTLVAPDAIG